jgi:hypothetical protein
MWKVATILPEVSTVASRLASSSCCLVTSSTWKMRPETKFAEAPEFKIAWKVRWPMRTSTRGSEGLVVLKRLARTAVGFSRRSCASFPGSAFWLLALDTR